MRSSRTGEFCSHTSLKHLIAGETDRCRKRGNTGAGEACSPVRGGEDEYSL